MVFRYSFLWRYCNVQQKTAHVSAPRFLMFNSFRRADVKHKQSDIEAVLQMNIIMKVLQVFFMFVGRVCYKTK